MLNMYCNVCVFLCFSGDAATKSYIAIFRVHLGDPEQSLSACQGANDRNCTRKT